MLILFAKNAATELCRSFHPAIQRAKIILNSGELGKIKSITTHMSFSKGMIAKPGDIRFDYDLGGGSLMDLGCKSFSF